MPKRTDIHRILVIGSGPIVIGQAAEFDYAGTQACLALREEGYEVILVNSNPATIMTDTDIADKVYMEPLTLEYLAKILRGQANDGSGKIYGLGHAIYTESDPRCELLKKYSKEVAEKSGHIEELELMMRIEKCGKPLITKLKNLDIPICANVDMYSGLVYRMLGIPDELFTPLFAIARMAGWAAHRMEELLTGGRIIRPAYKAIAKEKEYIKLSERE